MTSLNRSSLRAWARKAISDPALRYVILLFVVMRVVISLWAAVMLAMTDAPATPDDVLRPYQGIEPINGGPAKILLGVWQRFDTLWYVKIATQGYSPDDGSTVYFPLYPLLIKLLGKVLLENYLLAVLVVSNVAYVGVLFYLYKLAELELGKAASRRSVLYLSVLPTAFFFLVAYTESLFLLLTLAALYCAPKKPWGCWLSQICLMQ
jgi:hypothetical protein